MYMYRAIQSYVHLEVDTTVIPKDGNLAPQRHLQSHTKIAAFVWVPQSFISYYSSHYLLWLTFHYTYQISKAQYKTPTKAQLNL